MTRKCSHPFPFVCSAFGKTSDKKRFVTTTGKCLVERDSHEYNLITDTYLAISYLTDDKNTSGSVPILVDDDTKPMTAVPVKWDCVTVILCCMYLGGF